MSSQEFDLKGTATGALLGGLVASAICVGLYYVGVALGADYVPRDPEAMGVAVVPSYQPIISTMLSAVVSLGLVALLNKFAGAKAWPIFLGIAGLVFLAELYAPVWAFADTTTIVILELMHVPAALGIVGGIYWFGRKPALARSGQR